MAGGVGEWIERLDYHHRYMGHTSRVKRPASEYFARNIWISADPAERTLPCLVKLFGDHKFFIGSDYRHAEGFIHPIETARTAPARVAGDAVNRILGENAAHFFGI